MTEVTAIREASSMDKYGQIIRNLSDAALCVDCSGIILEWNKAAEELLGYMSYEIIQQHFSVIYPKHVHHQIPLLLDRMMQGMPVANVNASIVHKNGGQVPVNLSFSTLHVEEGKIAGFFLIARKLDQGKDIHIFLEDSQQDSYQESAGAAGAATGTGDTEAEGRRRTFEEIRMAILSRLGASQMTINQLATYANINWKTVENHLTYLIGKGFVHEVFKSDYVRIMEATASGREYLAQAKERSRNVEEELP